MLRSVVLLIASLFVSLVAHAHCAGLVLSADVVPLGSMYLNTLAQVRKYQLPASFRVCGAHYAAAEDGDSLSDDEDAVGQRGQGAGGGSTAQASLVFPQVFDLDCSVPAVGHGRVVLLIASASSCAGVFLLEPSGSRAHFVAPSFRAYHRLLLMHIGIPHWIYAFTDEGMPNATRVSKQCKAKTKTA